MKRRAFLRLMAGLSLAAVRVKRAAGKSMPILKGIHLTTGFDASVVNLLGANWWCGTDEVLRIIRDTAQQEPFNAITATYVYRIPHDASAQEIQAVQQLPTFNNEFILMNEGDLNNLTTQYVADRVVAAVANIQAADPTRTNKIMLNAGSQHAGTAYVADVLARLPLSTIDYIDGLTWHYYPQTDPTPGGIYDENRLRNFLSMVCAYTAQAGFSKAWLAEFGWTATANPERIVNRLPRFVAVMNEFPILKRWNFYAANVEAYTRLVNGTGVTSVGAAYKRVNAD